MAENREDYYKTFKLKGFMNENFNPEAFNIFFSIELSNKIRDHGIEYRGAMIYVIHKTIAKFKKEQAAALKNKIKDAKSFVDRLFRIANHTILRMKENENVKKKIEEEMAISIKEPKPVADNNNNAYIFVPDPPPEGGGKRHRRQKTRRSRNHRVKTKRSNRK